MTRSKLIKGLSFLDRQYVKGESLHLNSFAFDFTVKSRFFHDFKRELKDPDFAKRLGQEMASALLGSINTPKQRSSASAKTNGPFYNPDEHEENNPDYLLYKLTDDVNPSDGFTFFHGFYNWARLQEEPRNSKLEALEIAKGCYIKMMLFMRDFDQLPFPFHVDYAFCFAINQQCKLGYSARQLRDKILNALRPKFKPGQKPASPLKSSKFSDDFKRLLDIIAPAFDKKTKLSRGNKINKYSLLESAITYVNSQIAEKDKIDEAEFIDKYFKFRKAERVAIDLTRRLNNKSIATIERAIGLRK